RDRQASSHGEGLVPLDGVTVQPEVVPAAAARLRQEIKPQEGEDLADDLAGGLAVVHHVEGVWGGGVIHQGDGQVATQRRGYESVQRFVQVGDLVLTRPGDEQRQVRR